MSNEDDTYEVGFKKPPVATRFSAGQSGNPKGRPKGAKNFDTVISKELAVKVDIMENGKRRTISKLEAIGKQLVNKAASGDAKCLPIVMQETRRIEEKNGALPPQGVVNVREDKLVLESLIARMKKSQTEGEPA